MTLSIYEPELVLQRSFDVSEPHFCVDLPRGVMTVSAVLGGKALDIKDGEMIINRGEQSDSLYAFCSTIGAYTDTVVVRLWLCKQFSTVNIHIEDATDYYCRIIGNVNGLSMTTLKPTEGDFSFVMDNAQAADRWAFRMPRQSDKSITMEVWDRMENTIAAIVPLGELLEEAGYDWDAENLQDVSLEVDPITKLVIVTVSPWDEGRTFEYKY